MEWTSIQEKYPDKDGEYLVSGGGKVWVATFMMISNIRGFCNGCRNPTIEAWMPFPEPYNNTLRGNGMDREKVIKGLERCKLYNKVKCDKCPYDYNGRGNGKSECTAELAEDALALLKEQEAELSFREAKAITHTATKLDDATCPSCGNVVGEKQIWEGRKIFIQWKYCIFCGQKLDWEGW